MTNLIVLKEKYTMMIIEMVREPDTGEGVRYSEDTSEAFEAWAQAELDAKRYVPLLYRLDEIPFEDLDYDLALLSGKAWLGYVESHSETLEPFEKTGIFCNILVILTPHGVDGEFDTEWLHVMGEAHCGLKEEKLGFHYLNQRADLESNDKGEIVSEKAYHELQSLHERLCQLREDRYQANYREENLTYSPENREEYLEWVESQSTAGEHGRVLASLSAIPLEERDYTLKLWYAISLQDRGIMGPQRECGPAETMKDDLKASLDVLESIKEEGAEDTRWLMRMALAHEYLDEPEKALPYLDRWWPLEHNPIEQDRIRGMWVECMPRAVITGIRVEQTNKDSEA